MRTGLEISNYTRVDLPLSKSACQYEPKHLRSSLNYRRIRSDCLDQIFDKIGTPYNMWMMGKGFVLLHGYIIVIMICYIIHCKFRHIPGTKVVARGASLGQALLRKL